MDTDFEKVIVLRGECTELELIQPAEWISDCPLLLQNLRKGEASRIRLPGIRKNEASGFYLAHSFIFLALISSGMFTI